MLTGLSIKNFALIEGLQVSFDNGLTTITGETGAGKSLLLGALGLLLGNRADLNSVKDSSKKCVIEGNFNITNYKLTSFFGQQDLDYEQETIIRREILPSGKSRAFVNDSPVTLNTLSLLGNKLIDIHSQHQTLEITDNSFQLEVLDALAGSERELQSYKRGLEKLKAKEKELKTLVESQNEFTKEYDYNAFLLKELEEAKLKKGELEELEQQYETLNNVEEIQEKLSGSLTIIATEEVGIQDQLNSIKNSIQKISSFSEALGNLNERINSVYIELDDINAALEQQLEILEADPKQLAYVNNRLEFIHSLQQKHTVASINELLEISIDLKEKVSRTENMGEDISRLTDEVEQVKLQLNGVAEKIHNKRKKALPNLVKELETILHELGMPNATFKSTLVPVEQYFPNGKDNFEFLFSANKGTSYGVLKKVASGGELSRIVLAIKAVLSRFSQLPTIIFDEIDTGVSGEIANKMAVLMMEMSRNLQVFSITHLPQIAAKGNMQYKVFKEDIDDITQTQLRLLSDDERIVEIAQMIGGKEVTDTALVHAKSLLHI